MLTQKNLIRQLIPKTVGSFTPGNFFNFGLVKTQPEVIIIGAGISGLVAGYWLAKQGVKFTILEARDRLGGRVFSQTIDREENLVIEMGAEWIGASHERLISLCQELDLELQNNQFDTHLIYGGKYFRHNEWDFSDDWYCRYKKLLDTYAHLSEADKLKLDKIDWWHYLIENGISDRDVDLKDLIDSANFGESIRFVSAFAALDEFIEAKETHQTDYKIKGGNNRLIEAIADRIGRDRILLNRKVAAIAQSGRTVTISCNDGTNWECDRVICTLPTFALKNIAWHPALPEDKIDAIAALQYARIDKNAVLYDRRFWHDESFETITDGPAHYVYHGTKNQPSQKGVLISYTTGDKADIMARQSEEGRMSLVDRALEPAFGSTKQYAIRQINYHWGNDEYSKGSYALYGKGQWFSIRPILRRKFGKVHFAGEHLADWQGFMEGAANTGEEAAEAILG